MKPERWLLIGLSFALTLAGLGTLRGELLAFALPLLAYLGAAYLAAPRAGAGQFAARRTLERAHARPSQPVQMEMSLTQSMGTVVWR